jgi:hypothetical protein
MEVDRVNNSSVAEYKIDSEVFSTLPPLYQMVAEILIERGRWLLIAEGPVKR